MESKFFQKFWNLFFHHIIMSMRRTESCRRNQCGKMLHFSIIQETWKLENSFSMWAILNGFDRSHHCIYMFLLFAISNTALVPLLGCLSIGVNCITEAIPSSTTMWVTRQSGAVSFCQQKKKYSPFQMLRIFFWYWTPCMSKLQQNNTCTSSGHQQHTCQIWSQFDDGFRVTQGTERHRKIPCFGWKQYLGWYCAWERSWGDRSVHNVH